jgi:hypothetical protein
MEDEAAKETDNRASFSFFNTGYNSCHDLLKRGSVSAAFSCSYELVHVSVNRNGAGNIENVLANFVYYWLISIN